VFLLDPPTGELHERDGSEATVGDDSTGGTGRETLNIKNKLGRTAGIAIAAAGIVALNLPGEASASTAEADGEAKLPADTTAWWTTTP